jgi:hypothetical protein
VDGVVGVDGVVEPWQVTGLFPAVALAAPEVVSAAVSTPLAAPSSMTMALQSATEQCSGG